MEIVTIATLWLSIFALTASDPVNPDSSSCARVEAALDDLNNAIQQLKTDVADIKANVGNQQNRYKQCPKGFEYVSSVDGCYKVVTKNAKWQMAGLECRMLHQDAHLLVINSSAEQTAIRSLLQRTVDSNNGCTGSEYGKFFWTAGQRIDPSSRSPFVWRVTSTDTYSDKLATMNYTDWDGGQPSYSGGNESCMHLWDSKTYRWSDKACSIGMCYICEIDI